MPRRWVPTELMWQVWQVQRRGMGFEHPFFWKRWRNGRSTFKHPQKLIVVEQLLLFFFGQRSCYILLALSPEFFRCKARLFSKQQKHPPDVPPVPSARSSPSGIPVIDRAVGYSGCHSACVITCVVLYQVSAIFRPQKDTKNFRAILVVIWSDKIFIIFDGWIFVICLVFSHL